MLSYLHIVNFAIIEDTVIHFKPGVTIFTGETGAGKSILVNALSVLMGKRARTDLIRTGKDYFKVEGIFSVSPAIAEKIKEEGIECDGGQLIITRKLNRNGRGICTMNGSFCTVKQIEQTASRLIRLHEQNENLELLSSRFCENVIDHFDSKITEQFASYEGLYKKWKEIHDTLLQYEKTKQERARQIDTLQYELEQIDKAGLQEGEDDEIDQKLQVLENHERILHNLQAALSILTADEGTENQLAEASADLEKASQYDKALKEPFQSIQSAGFSVEDAIESLNSYIAESDFSEEELEGLQDRRETINELKRKYGPEISDVLSYAENSRKKYDELSGINDSSKSLREQYAFLTEKIKKKAGLLNQSRRTAASRFFDRLLPSLKDMGLDHARMTLSITESKEPSRWGCNSMEFLFSANPGEPLRPVREVASGGEISRIALAIEILNYQFFEDETLVFDEVDVGISGKTAMEVAAKIKTLSRHAQVICITHLPQTASIADSHFQIEKTVRKGRTYSGVRELSPDEHLQAVARMISGVSHSEGGLKSAEEMKKMLNS